MYKGPEVLSFWRLALLSSIRNNGPDLTTRQMYILLTVYMSQPPHTVRGLAKQMGVTKPVITRALNCLEKLGYLKRSPDESDKRSILIQRTVKGSVFLRDFADLIEDPALTAG
jgi:DNA-binding MarR family transcriptional regulator